ncbi:small ribosomal subunit protein bS6-like [Ylistrum balloti]|uniref:small ribosomal subunit protein bS6-like n=1 Tax=Ylistrum balloti TaxID=509963 RepID=UPI002905D2A6|nr:small ribosomal subunit protein bS6-like [Ylistrum balloti]
MRKYETILLLDDALSQADIDTFIDELKGFVNKHGAQSSESQPWGRKKLAYEIKKKQYAHYVFFRFTSPGQTPHELEQLLRIEKRVLRFQTYLDSGEIEEEAVHFKNYQKLATYLTARGKIRPCRTTRFNAAQQRLLSQQIKRARVLGLLPFTTVGV